MRTRAPILAAPLTLIATVVLIAASGSRATPQLPALTTKAMSAADSASTTKLIQDQIDSPLVADDVPGLLIGVWDPQRGVYLHGFGKADTKSGRLPAAGDAFRIGSVTKTFTATVVLQLVAQGKLALDGQVRSFAPALAAGYPAVGTRTIRQLLSMRSGLPEYADALIGPQSKTPKKVWTADQLIALALRSGKIEPAGGAKAVYINTNYIVLGEVARAVTGKPIAQLVRQRLLIPLGLTHTSFPSGADTRLRGAFTRGYLNPAGAEEIKKDGGRATAGQDATDWSATWAGAAGVMSTTLGDLARWTASELGTTLLPPALQQQRRHGYAAASYFRYGLGLQILKGNGWVGHWGGIPGWTTAAFHQPKTGRTVVMSINGCCGGEPTLATAFVLNALYPGAIELQ